jgi:uncharacterized protein (TIGR02452 family)
MHSLCRNGYQYSDSTWVRVDEKTLIAAARRDERIDFSQRGNGQAGGSCPGGDPFKGVLRLPRLTVGTGEWDADTAGFGGPLLNAMVVDADCLQVLSVLQDLPDALNVAVLNMANATTPGGGYVNGAGAQEESIFRRCSLRLHLDCKRSNSRRLYPIPEIGAVYSPAVTLLRAPESDDYAFLPRPRPFACISAAAYNRPRLVHTKAGAGSGTGEARLAPKEERGTLHKIGAILRCALEKGHDCVVLGALGTGAFQNPARHVAELFRRALETPVALEGLVGENKVALGSLFRCVVFAIIQDRNSSHAASPEGNLRPFVDVFDTVDLDTLGMLSFPDIRRAPPVAFSRVGVGSSSSSSSSSGRSGLVADGPLSVIFLDIDGVMLPDAEEGQAQEGRKFPRSCLDALAKLVEATGAVLVLSSTWRSDPAAQADIIEQFVQYGPVLGSLEAIGVNEGAFALTTSLEHHEGRQLEIARFLEGTCVQIHSWVALDDEELLLEPRNQKHRAVFNGHVVKTDSRCGLTDSDAEQALAILRRANTT